jgi:predicted esterase YcpF (UPF0227 family)
MNWSDWVQDKKSVVLYIHGFLSSPLSAKAEITRKWLNQNYPDVEFYCPHLPPYPNETQIILEKLVEKLSSDSVYLIGSSLGGFWATYLAEQFNLPAVLINPAVKPQNFMPSYLDIDVKSYHTDECYRLQERHINEIIAADIPVTRLKNYWLMVQTGDETLDYRQAVEKYSGCKQTIEEGGDHSFQGYENHLESIVGWFEHFYLKNFTPS